MICPKCGNRVGEDDVFCSECGTKLSLEVEQKEVKEEKEVSKKKVNNLVGKGKSVFKNYLETWQEFSLWMNTKQQIKWIVSHVVVMLVVGFLLMVLCSGCCLRHEWIEATCTYPRTCIKCEKTEGDVLEHTWKEATCTKPETCAVCGATQGSSLGHTWKEATCTEPETCEVCEATQGDALGHDWMEATCTEPETCAVCWETQGDALGHYWMEATCTEPETCYVCWETYGDVAEHELDSKGKCYNCGEQVGFQLNMSNYSSYIKIIFTNEGKKSDGKYYYRVNVEPLQPVKFYNVSITMNIKREVYLESTRYSRINGELGLLNRDGSYSFTLLEEEAIPFNLNTEGYGNLSRYATVPPKDGITFEGMSHKNGGIKNISGYIVE